MSEETPNAFISYSWESEAHKAWVRKLASRLTMNGVEVRLDQWHVRPGTSLTRFMEEEVSACDYVLVICTKAYRDKSVERSGGVGYEQQIISGHVVAGIPREKFIPILRSGRFDPGNECAIPPHFLGIYVIDMRDDNAFDTKLEELLRAIYKQPAYSPPPLGNKPNFHMADDDGSIGRNPVSSKMIAAEHLRLPSLELDGWHFLVPKKLKNRLNDNITFQGVRARNALNIGDIVKLRIEWKPPSDSDSRFEGMWVTVQGKVGIYILGMPDKMPAFAKEWGHNVLQANGHVIFLPEHIVSALEYEDGK